MPSFKRKSLNTYFFFFLKHNKDRYLCRHLCSKTLVLESTIKRALPPCDQICFELTRTHNFAGEICPFEKYCEKGCPCPFYQCEKISYEKTLVPVWDMNNEITEGMLIVSKNLTTVKF